jgi:dihydrolipoamide dehydrogenase
VDDRSRGFVKVLSDAESGIVLGVHIVGPHASDIIGEACLAVSSQAHIDDITLTMHAHPTFSESIEEAVERLEHKAIHIFDPASLRNSPKA